MAVSPQTRVRSKARRPPAPLLRVSRGTGFPSLSREVAPLPRNQKDPNGYYVMLGLHPWASRGEIRRVYRALARRFHPDGTAPNERLFRRYAEIYGVLSDPVLRAKYHATPDDSLYVDRHVRVLLEANGVPLPLEQKKTESGYDYYRMGVHEDDDEFASRWYEALIDDLGRLGYRKVIKLCLSDTRQGFDPTTRVLYLPRAGQDLFPLVRQQFLSQLS